MRTVRTRWVVGAVLVAGLLVGFAFLRRHLPRSWLLRNGDWRFSQSGFVYSLKFSRDGTVLVREDDRFLYHGTYELTTGSTVMVHAGNPLPWGEVGRLQFSADGTSLLSTGRSLGMIHYEHH